MTLFWTPRFQGPPIKKNATEVSLLGGGGAVFIIRGTGLNRWNNWKKIYSVQPGNSSTSFKKLNFWQLFFSPRTYLPRQAAYPALPGFTQQVCQFVDICRQQNTTRPAVTRKTQLRLPRRAGFVAFTLASSPTPHHKPPTILNQCNNPGIA